MERFYARSRRAIPAQNGEASRRLRTVRHELIEPLICSPGNVNWHHNGPMPNLGRFRLVHISCRPCENYTETDSGAA